MDKDFVKVADTLILTLYEGPVVTNTSPIACPPAQIGLQRTHGQIPPRLRWSRRVGTGTVLPRTRQPKEGKLQEGFGGRIGPEKLLSSSSSVESLSQRAFIEINCIRLRLPVPIHRVEALTPVFLRGVQLVYFRCSDLDGVRLNAPDEFTDARRDRRKYYL